MRTRTDGQARTRAEEVMQARGMGPSELARRMGWHGSNLSRVFSGKRQLNPSAARSVASVLQVTVADLYQPMGSPIPEPIVLDRARNTRTFDDRLRAIMKVLGIERYEDLMRFLLAEDYSGMAPHMARRLRSALEAVDREGYDGFGGS